MTIRMPKLRVSGAGLVEDTATLGGSGRDDPSGSVAGFTCRKRGFDPRVGVGVLMQDRDLGGMQGVTPLHSLLSCHCRSWFRVLGVHVVAGGSLPPHLSMHVRSTSPTPLSSVSVSCVLPPSCEARTTV